MTLEERRQALADQASLAERERELAAELLAWDVKIEAARREQERLRQEIPAVERSLAGAEAGLAESGARLDGGMERLGRWVNFLYRYGAVSYLEVLLGAVDFNQFVERAEMVGMIIAGQVRMLDEVREAVALKREQALALERARAELAAKSSLLAENLKEMEEAKAGRGAFLAEIGQQSAVLAAKVARTETLWYRSLDSLHYLLTHLDVLPWRKLKPDKVAFTGKGLRLEVSEGVINRTFFEEGDAKLAGLSVRCAPGLFTISGEAPEGAGFRLDGNFVPAREGKVRFQPQNMYLAGTPVSREVVGFVSSERGMAMDFGGYLHGYCIAGVRAEERKLVVTLAGN